jgi:BCD family chlorophyll transporter-like MFS transporter
MTMRHRDPEAGLGWAAIVRLGLVQMALGAVVVLCTSTLNRLMVVELALPAVLPGALVALHYGVQLCRPAWGVLSDAGGRRSGWILAGMAILALGGLGASAGVWLMASHPVAGLLLSVVAYALIGLGVGAAGTSLLALLATATVPRRRAAAATITWLMMIAGIALTAAGVGAMLDPYGPVRLMTITSGVCGGAVVLTALALWRLEARLRLPAGPAVETAGVTLRQGLAEVWAEPAARRFTVFVFLSMTAYFMQELILEPYAGLVFGFSPGQSTSLGGAQNGGVFLGMVLVGTLATGFGLGSLRSWVGVGCLGSAAALVLIAVLGQTGPVVPLAAAVAGLGLFNGIFAVAAIGSMMALAGQGRGGREGTRMGLWGGAQAIAAGFGGLAGAAGADLLRRLLADDAAGFGTVFLLEAALFLAAAHLAQQAIAAGPAPRRLVPGE